MGQNWFLETYAVLNEPYMNNDTMKNEVLTFLVKLKHNERIFSASPDLQDYLTWKRRNEEKEKAEKEEEENGQSLEQGLVDQKLAMKKTESV